MQFNHRPQQAVLLFLFAFLLHFSLLSPGFIVYDGVNQILEARDGVYSDWHPPLMAMIWRIIDQFIPGTVGMLLLQLGLLWLGLALIFVGHLRHRLGDKGAALMTLLPFTPAVFGISGAILKDMLMCGALLCGFGLTGTIKSGQPFAQSAPRLIACVAMLWLAIMLRHNAILAVLPLLALALRNLMPQRLIISLTLTLVIAGALFAVSGKINDKLADRHTHPWVASAAFDVAGVIVRMNAADQQQALFDQLAASLNGSGSFQPLLKAYTAEYWREIFRTQPPTLQLPSNAMGARLHGFESLSDDQRQSLKQLWLQTIAEQPSLWLDHRLAVSRYILGLVPNTIWGPVIMYREFPTDLAWAYRQVPLATPLQIALEQWLSSLSYDWYFQPWPYCLLTLMLFLVTLPSVRQGKHIEASVLSCSALLYELGVMIAAPSPDFRYSHYLIVCALLSVLLLAKPTSSHDHSRND